MYTTNVHMHSILYAICVQYTYTYVYAICIHMYVRMYVCMYTSMYVLMYACMYVCMSVSSVSVWLLLPLQDSTAAVVAVTTKTTIRLSPQPSPPPVTLTHPASSQRKGNIQAQLTRSFSEDNILGTGYAWLSFVAKGGVGGAACSRISLPILCTLVWLCLYTVCWSMCGLAGGERNTE